MNGKLEKLNQEIEKTEARLESHLPHPESVTDGQVSTILKVLFHRGDTKRLVAQVLTENRKEDTE